MLPPGLLIQVAQTLWHQGWRVMMGELAPPDKGGNYQRPPSQFRHSINAPEDGPFPEASGRYHLMVGWGCPWAHRTLLVRSLRGLETCIPLVMVEPDPSRGGWVFPQGFQGCSTLRQFYERRVPGYGGRATVPVLWDQESGTIVNNESAEIMVQLNQFFSPWANPNAPDLYPKALQGTIDTWNQEIYTTINNGVYACGFAQTQEAYDRACTALFATLDRIETVLGQQPFLCGDTVTLADLRLFTTLIRFEVAYGDLFKCNLKPIAAYPHLFQYRRHLYQLPGVAQTCNFEAIKRDYYGNLFPLNPGGLIPLGPSLGVILGD